MSKVKSNPNLQILSLSRRRILCSGGELWQLYIDRHAQHQLEKLYISDAFRVAFERWSITPDVWIVDQIVDILEQSLWSTEKLDDYTCLFLKDFSFKKENPGANQIIVGDLYRQLQIAMSEALTISNRHMGRSIQIELLRCGDVEANPGPFGEDASTRPYRRPENTGGITERDGSIYHYSHSLHEHLLAEENSFPGHGGRLVIAFLRDLHDESPPSVSKEKSVSACAPKERALRKAEHSSANGSVEVETLEVGQLASPVLNSAISPVISHDDLVRLSECLCTLQSIYTAFGFVSEKKDFHAVVKTLKHWTKCASECGWLAFAKYKFTAFYAAWAPLIHREMPEKPFKEPDLPHMLIGGRFGRFVLKHLGFGGQAWSVHQKHEFLSSILYAKKGMPRVSESVLEESAKQMARDLTKAPTFPVPEILTPWADIENNDVEHMATRATVKDSLRRTVREIFGKNKKDLSLAGCFRDPVCPSFSANYNNTRGVLGTVGYLRDLEFELMNSGFFKKGAEGKFEYVSEQQALDEGKIEEQIDQDCRDLVYCSDYHGIRKQYDEVLANAIRRAWKEAPVVEPVPLPEPFKVRVISKGPPNLYFVLKSIQRKLWSTLRRNQRTFKLIGEPCTPEILKTLLGVPKNQKKGKFLLSVDYKAATDGLFSFVSETICDEICNLWDLPLDSKLRQMLHRSLTGHVFPASLFTEEELTERERSLWGELYVPQLNGQLMGSVTSFPFLCIANAAILRWCKEIDAKRRLTLDQAMMAINGDDAATWIGIAGYNAWKKLMKHFGFKASPGKVYCSEEFVNINSTTYRVTLEGYVHVKYLNMGLLKGMKRSGGNVGLSDITGGFSSLGSRHRELIDTLPPGIIDQVRKMFIREHWETLSKAKVPWNVCESYGGVGLAPHYSVEYIPNSAQGDDLGCFVRKLKFGPTDADRRGCRMIHTGMVDPVKIIKDPALSGAMEALLELLPDVKSFYLPRGKIQKADDPTLGRFQIALFYCRIDSVLRNPIDTSMAAWIHNVRVWQTCYQRCRELGVRPFSGDILSYSRRLGCSFVDPFH